MPNNKDASNDNIVLASRIIKTRRAPSASIKHPLDAVIDVEDVLRGSLRSNQLKNLDVIFNCSDDKKTAYKSIFRNSLCFLYGSLQKINRKTVFVVDDFIGTNKVALDIAKASLNEDPNVLRSQVVDVGGFSLASRPEVLKNSRELVDSEVVNMRKWLVDHNLPFDLDTAWSLQLFFQMRASRRVSNDKKGLSVLGLIKKNPLMLADFSVDLPVSKLQAVFENMKDVKISPEMEILARISEILFRAARKGHSCVPFDKLYYFPAIKTLLDLLGVPKNEYGKKLKELIFQNAEFRASDVILESRGIYPLLSDIKKDLHEQMKAAEGLTKEELQKYNYGKIVPTWLVDRLALFAYLPKLYYSECFVAKALHAHIKHGVSPISVPISYFKNLTDEQRLAVDRALSHPISVIIGSAGTGKTFVIHRLRSIAEASGRKAFILAPTATAAANAGHDGTFSDYFTIHRFAHISPLDEDLGTTESQLSGSIEKIEDGDVVIIDEMSMCTLPVINTFFKSLQDTLGCHIVFVGDDQQLPAIGANIFHNFAQGFFGDDIPVTKLSVNQRSKSNLVQFTTDIRAGIFNVPDCDEIHLVPSTAKAFFHSHKDLMEHNNVMVLTSSHACQYRLNDMLHELLNKNGKPIHFLSRDGESVINTPFFVGDPVVAIRNDYYELNENGEEQLEMFATKGLRHKDRKTSIYNGTFGYIDSFSEDENTVYIRLFPPEVSSEGLLLPYTVEELSLLFEVAYAVTTHKAQGGERPIVVFVMDASKGVSISRSMLYTAATRAKQSLYLIGKEEDFRAAVAKKEDMVLSLLPYRYRMEKQAPAATSHSSVLPAVGENAWVPKRKRSS